MAWYRDRLGIPVSEYGHAFLWREHGTPQRTGYTVWSPFRHDTTYFQPSDAEFMVNFRVADLAALLAELVREGVTIVGGIQDEPNGRFAWILDPEGNKIELWQPVDPEQDPYLPR